MFIGRVLIEDKEISTKIISHNVHQQPLILAGNFNINFAQDK